MASDPTQSTQTGLGASVSTARAESGAGVTGTWPTQGTGGAPTSGAAPPAKRTVCDHCRRRRIRCDGQFPCVQCTNAALSCKRDHVPKKRGPKAGHGRVINELRAQETQGSQRSSRESSSDPADRSTDGGDISAPQTAPNSVPSSPRDTGSRTPLGPRSRQGSRDQYRPNTRSYAYLIPQCVDLYYLHIYPIMPLVYMPDIRVMIYRPMTPPEENLIYALCALTCLHMSGKSIQAKGPDSWEAAGRFFIDECITVRHSYDFLEDQSLYAVISSFWLSTSFFEINQSRKSWVYLREALTLALDLGLDNDLTYVDLSPEEKLCRLRVFWILFVTERSFAILRNKPITFKKTPQLPQTRHPYETPDIQSGFRQLISSYVPLDESFVAAWNDSSDPRVSATTYLHLQNILARPPGFVTRSRATTPSSEETLRSLPDIITPSSTNVPAVFDPTQTSATQTESGSDLQPHPTIPFTFITPAAAADTTEPDPEPTAIQQADLLITQQWLRLIVWRSSQQRQLLSWSSPHESMDHAFPLEIARRTASILNSLPTTAVEVHGMGIFEKIFKIGFAYVDALSACDASGPGVGSRFGMGMDFASGEVGVLGIGRQGYKIDPLEFFVKTLSGSPNSRTQFADKLIAHAGQVPGGMKMALSPSPKMLGVAAPALAPAPGHMTPAGWAPLPAWHSAHSHMHGAVLGEVADDDDSDDHALPRTKRIRMDEETMPPPPPPPPPQPPQAIPAAQVQQAPPTAIPASYSNEFDVDVGLLSPTGSEHGVSGFGGGIPGLTTAGVFFEQPMMPNTGTSNWATGGDLPTPTQIQPLNPFSYGPTMTSEEYAYAAFGADGNGNQMCGGGMQQASQGYPQYHEQQQQMQPQQMQQQQMQQQQMQPQQHMQQHQSLQQQQHLSAPGTGTSTPIGEGHQQGSFGMGMRFQQDQGTKRSWEGITGSGTWHTG